MTNSEDRPNPDGRRTWQLPLRRAGVTAILAAGLLLLGGCASSGPPKPTKLEGSIVAAADLNPSVNQRPSPLLLRIYELRSPTAFNQADFMSIYQADQATLAADLVAREEIMLQPGERRPFNRQLAPETRFIGVVGVYRNLERATWRAVVAVKPGQSQKISVRADALALTAAALP